MSFEQTYIELFSEHHLRAKVATLKIAFDLAVARCIAAGGDQQYWSLEFKGKYRDPWLWEVMTDGMTEEEMGILRGLQFEGHGVQPPAILKEGIVLAVTHDLSTDSLFSNSTTKESDDYVDGSDERTQIP